MITSLIVGAGIVILAFWVVISSQKRKTSLLKKELQRFQEVLKDVDEEAKLIIRTDFELNKTQEKVQKLSAFLKDMEHFSDSAIATLDEELMFSQITPRFINNLGSEKCAIFYFTGQVRQCIGFSEEQLKMVMEQVMNNRNTFATAACVEGLRPLLGAEEVYVRELKTKKGIVGALIFASTAKDSGGFHVREMVAILSNVISQAVDTIWFFEESFHKREELESKVRERTKELVDTLNELKKMNRHKSEFISSVSHELRTPLTSIKGYASLLARGKFGVLPDEIKSRLEKIDEHADKLVEMVNGLLDIARIESGRIELKLAPYDINAIIKDVVDLLYPQIKAKNIDVPLRLTAEPLWVIADKELIERVLINLINNAVKFTPEHGTISVGASPQEKEAVVSVKDTGIGLQETDYEHIFDEFYRVDNEINQQVKGTGLGLPLVKKIVEQAHGGRIWVKSTPNEGSEFLFTLKRR